MATAQKSNGKAAQITTADLEAQIATLKEDIAALTGSIAEMGVQKGNALKGEAEARAASLRAQGEKTAEQIKAHGKAAAAKAQDSASAAFAEAETRVRENPAAAVGIAAGAGFLLGLFMSRRSG